jgi:hypothetical protein
VLGSRQNNKEKKMKKIAKRILTVFMLSAVFVQADVLTAVLSDGADQELYGDGTAKWVGQTTARIGADAATRQNSYVMPFLLPTLPEGQSITSVSLDITLKSQSYVKADGADPVWNIDLYGVRASDSVAVDLNNDGYMGENDAAATKIEDNFFEGINLVIAPGDYSTSAAGSIALGDWLQSYYTGNTPNQTYAFLRLSPDLATLYADAGGSRYLEIYTGNDGTNAPELIITTGVIPEPATTGMLGVGALAIALIRRIKM